MAQSLNGAIIYLALSICASLSIAGYAWHSSHMRGRKTFVCGTVSSCLWMLGSVVARLNSSFEGQYFAEIVRVLGVSTLPVWVFAFSRAYCGKPLGRRLLRALFVLPVLTWFVMATTFWSHLYFSWMRAAVPGDGSHGELVIRFGAYFWWVHVPYSYALTLLSLLLVANEIGRVPRAFRGKMIYFLCALSIPVFIDAASLANIWKGYSTAFILPIFPFMMGVAMFRHDILSLSAVAYESIVQNIRDGVIMLNGDDTVLDINVAALLVLGATRREITGKPLALAFASWPELLDCCRDSKVSECEISRQNHEETRHYLLQISNVMGVDNAVDARTLTLCDITDSKNYRNSLENLAFYDPLTRLANRRKFGEEVENLLRLAARTPQQFAILYFDLNRFKAVNDTLGHEYGDQLLQYVALRAGETLRAPDFVARLGGDEFVVLLHGATPTDIENVVARLTENVEQPTTVNGHILLPQLSIGAAFYPANGSTLREMLHCADASMYRAKAEGGGFNFAGY